MRLLCNYNNYSSNYLSPFLQLHFLVKFIASVSRFMWHVILFDSSFVTSICIVWQLHTQVNFNFFFILHWYTSFLKEKTFMFWWTSLLWCTWREWTTLFYSVFAPSTKNRLHLGFSWYILHTCTLENVNHVLLRSWQFAHTLQTGCDEGRDCACAPSCIIHHAQIHSM